MEPISKHITYAEGTVSTKAKALGIPNHPSPELLEVMRYTASKVFEPVREHFKTPIEILSFFRSSKVNIAVGGSSTSQHCLGEAIDMSGKKYGLSNAEIFEYILVNLKFDQLIWEFGDDDEPDWVHVSVRKKGNRGQVLRAKKVAGKTKYFRM